MAFELFTKKQSHGGPPAVAITKRGHFSINSSAVDRLNKTKYVHLYWDQEQSKVGLRPLAKKDEHSYLINYSTRGNVGAVSASAFLKDLGYPIKETKSFPATWNAKDELLEFKIFEKKGQPRRFPRL
jgi:hypothetical protein